MHVVAYALVAKRSRCPKCGAKANDACLGPGNQFLPLAQTHHERLAIVSERYSREGARVDA